jgi:hypothetical protein
MAGTALNHPLVRDYLRELDAALAGLPAWRAGELREQITTHLDDVLGPDASDQEAAAALHRLGAPRDLAAEAGAGAAGPAQAAAAEAGAGTTSPAPAGRRPRRGLPAGRGRRFWALATAVVILAAGGTGYIASVEAASPLQIDGTEGWWYPQDAAHQVETEADGASQDTVPIRTGQRQGLFFQVNNQSAWTQTIIGFGGNAWPSPGAPYAQLSVSTRGYAHGWPGLPRSDHYSMRGVIPPDSSRILRIMWTSGCALAGIDHLVLRVRVGLIQRTEVVSLDGEWALSGPGCG